MQEAKGDLWTYQPADVRCITTNGDVAGIGEVHAVMGRGVARQAAERFPGLDRLFAPQLRRYGNRPMKLILIEFGRVWLVSFPVKRHWREPAVLDLILDSALKLRDMADKFGWKYVVLPRPGCGNGGRDWVSEVRPLLIDVLDDRFTVVIP